jgi:hypothetical protein
MQIEQIKNTYSSTPISRSTDTYTTWVDPKTHKHEYTHTVYTYQVYDRKGHVKEEQLTKRVEVEA